jgi:hypothetical protein
VCLSGWTVSQGSRLTTRSVQSCSAGRVPFLGRETVWLSPPGSIVEQVLRDLSNVFRLLSQFRLVVRPGPPRSVLALQGLFYGRPQICEAGQVDV